MFVENVGLNKINKMTIITCNPKINATKIECIIGEKKRINFSLKNTC